MLVAGLKIHRDFHELLAELADYRLPDHSITQDSVVALGLAVSHAHAHAHARDSGGRILRELLYELNGMGRPPSPSLHRQKNTTDMPVFGLIPGHRAPDEQHGGLRLPYQAEVDEVPGLLAQGWTPDDPEILDKLGLRADAQRTPART